MIGDQGSQWVGDPENEARLARAPVDGAGGPGAGNAAADAFLPDAPDGWTDLLTGCDGPRFWDRILSSEQARNARHNRTATIAMIEFAGLDEAARRWGSDLATQLFQRLARVLASGIRSSDHIARIGRSRFAVLLVETDEVRAINFVDRVRDRCCSEIDPGLHGFRMAIGWASPAAGGRLSEAVSSATERLEADLIGQA